MLLDIELDAVKLIELDAVKLKIVLVLNAI